MPFRLLILKSLLRNLYFCTQITIPMITKLEQLNMRALQSMINPKHFYFSLENCQKDMERWLFLKPSL